MSRSSAPIVATLLICAATLPAAARTDEIEVAPTFEELTGAVAPHGEWIDTDLYGWAWRPYANVVGDDFTPYATNGQWIYTQYGWYFESFYDWDWAAFHYGRWTQDSQLGWIWIPDLNWGPGWVTWRTGGGLVGWAPLPPVNLSVTNVSVWCWVEAPRFEEPNPDRHYAPPPPPAPKGTPPVHRSAAPPPPASRPVATPPTWRGHPPPPPGRRAAPRDPLQGLPATQTPLGAPTLAAPVVQTSARRAAPPPATTTQIVPVPSEAPRSRSVGPAPASRSAASTTAAPAPSRVPSLTPGTAPASRGTDPSPSPGARRSAAR